MHLYNMIKKQFMVISEGNMSVKEIRKRTGLTQKKFSELYHIPLETLRSWESSATSTLTQGLSPYVLELLDHRVRADFGKEVIK